MKYRAALSTIIKDALTMNNKPFPWPKAVGAGLAMSFPIIIGLLFNQLQYGLLAGMGGFAYLYAFPIPYAQLGKKLFFVVIGIALSSLLGSLTAPYPIAVAITMALIATITVFIFGALKISGPTAIFFVLIFAITADMPAVPLNEALLRAGLVLSGGIFSWVLAMVGFLLNPHGPEIRVVKRVYQQLALFLHSIGSQHYSEEKSKMMAVLKEAEETLAAGYIAWYPRPLFTRLMHLTLNANKIALLVIEEDMGPQTPLDPKQIAPIEHLGNHLHHRKSRQLADELEELVTTLPQSTPIPSGNRQQILDKIRAIPTYLTETIESFPPIGSPKSHSLMERLLDALDRDSLIFITTIRFGFITFIAALISTQFDFFIRSYWIPLSAVAVMSGATLIATYHRAIQRSVGTMIGLIIASILLSFHPSGYLIAALIFLCTATVELFIVRNYGLAVIFITPNALLIAETITGGTQSFLSARLVDILIGSLIGILGVMSTGGRAASSRLPRAIRRTLRTQSQLLFTLFGKKRLDFIPRKERQVVRMRRNISNLNELYNAATGEIPTKQSLIEYYWPIIYSMERLSFLLERAAERNDLPELAPTDLAHLLYLFETLANAAASQIRTNIKRVPSLTGFPILEHEIMTLQKAFQHPEN